MIRVLYPPFGDSHVADGGVSVCRSQIGSSAPSNQGLSVPESELRLNPIKPSDLGIRALWVGLNFPLDTWNPFNETRWELELLAFDWRNERSESLRFHFRKEILAKATSQSDLVVDK